MKWNHGIFLVVFSVLSVADFVLTWLLLNRSSGMAFESNPVAAWFLHHLGWTGLAAFKATAVAGVGAVIWSLARRRPQAARTVLVFACITLCAVVGYSAVLLERLHSPEMLGYFDVMARNREASDEMEKIMERSRDYQLHVEKLYRAVAQGSIPLPDAVHLWLNHGLPEEPRWLSLLRNNGTSNEIEKQLAATLIFDLTDTWRLSRERKLSLHEQFCRRFGMELPQSLAQLHTLPPEIASRPIQTDFLDQPERGKTTRLQINLDLDDPIESSNRSGLVECGETGLRKTTRVDQNKTARTPTRWNANSIARILDSFGKTPLQWVATIGRVDFARWWFDGGATVSAKNDSAHTSPVRAIVTESERVDDKTRVVVSLLKRCGSLRVTIW